MQLTKLIPLPMPRPWGISNSGLHPELMPPGLDARGTPADAVAGDAAGG